MLLETAHIAAGEIAAIEQRVELIEHQIIDALVALNHQRI